MLRDFQQLQQQPDAGRGFREVEVEDTDAYVRALEPRATIEKEVLANGTILYHTDTAGLRKRYGFTPV